MDFNIDNFLSKFKNLKRPDETIERAVIESLSSLNLKKDEIIFNKKTGVVYLKINNNKKLFISLKKTELIKNINKKIGKSLVKDLI